MASCIVADCNYKFAIPISVRGYCLYKDMWEATVPLAKPSVLELENCTIHMILSLLLFQVTGLSWLKLCMVNEFAGK